MDWGSAVLLETTSSVTAAALSYNENTSSVQVSASFHLLYGDSLLRCQIYVLGTQARPFGQCSDLTQSTRCGDCLRVIPHKCLEQLRLNRPRRKDDKSGQSSIDGKKTSANNKVFGQNTYQVACGSLHLNLVHKLSNRPQLVQSRLVRRFTLASGLIFALIVIGLPFPPVALCFLKNRYSSLRRNPMPNIMETRDFKINNNKKKKQNIHPSNSTRGGIDSHLFAFRSATLHTPEER